MNFPLMKSVIAEKNNKQRRKNIESIILETIKTTTLLSFALIVPNALKIAPDLFPMHFKSQYTRYLQSAVVKMKQKHLIRFGSKNGKKFLALTDKGEQTLMKYQLKNFKLIKPKFWDQKWRVVIFDIKESKRRFRRELRENLKAIGFLKIQNSVWVYPYHCEELIILIKTCYGLGRSVLYMTVESIENDALIRNAFGLN